MEGRHARLLVCGLGLAASALAAGLIFARNGPDSYDTAIMLQVTQSMLRHHSFRVGVDTFGFNSPYASYGLGMSLLYLPLYAVAEHLHRDPTSWAMLTNAAVFALTAPALLWLSLVNGGTPRQSVVVAALTGFGTLLLPFTATGLSELGVALLVTVGLVGVSVARRRPVRGPALAGAASSAALIMRTDSAVLVAPVLLIGAWLAGREWRGVAASVLALLPGLVVVGAYNTLRFGLPWRAGYGAGQSFNHPVLSGLYGLLLSPGGGLLWYVPLTAVALAGLALAWRRSPILVGVAACLLGSRLLLFSAWWTWSGQVTWGPRFLAPAMPALAVGLLEVVRRFGRLPLVGTVVVVGIAAVSIAVQFVGAAVRPESNQQTAALSRITAAVPARQIVRYLDMPRVEQMQDAVLFDWRYFPILDEARELAAYQNLTGRYMGPPPHIARLGALVLVVCGGLAAALLASGRGELVGQPSRARPSSSTARTRLSSQTSPSAQAKPRASEDLPPEGR
jgi:hypothetical protein